MNKVHIEINNCCDCQNHYVQRIYTADSWEHIEGVYCSKVSDGSAGFGANGKHKLVVWDDWDCRSCANIPDWCPLLKKG